jgi:hypothetical protein
MHSAAPSTIIIIAIPATALNIGRLSGALVG